MVSSAVDLTKAQLVKELARIRREHAEDPEYEQLRKEWPKTWPM